MIYYVLCTLYFAPNPKFSERSYIIVLDKNNIVCVMIQKNHFILNMGNRSVSDGKARLGADLRH